MGGVFSAISSFGVRSLPSYFYERLFLKKNTLCVYTLCCWLPKGCRVTDRRRDSGQGGGVSQPGHVSPMEPVSPSEACLGRPAWSLTPHHLKPLLGKRFFTSGKGFLKPRLCGCCTLTPCQNTAAAVASAVCEADIRVLFHILVQC